MGAFTQLLLTYTVREEDQAMPHRLLSDAEISNAIRGARSRETTAESAAYELFAVSVTRSQHSLPDTLESRRVITSGILRRIVLSRLVQLGIDTVVADGDESVESTSAVLSVVRPEVHKEARAWLALYLWAFSPSRQTLSKVGKRFQVEGRSIARWVETVYPAIADKLAVLESLAQSQASAGGLLRAADEHGSYLSEPTRQELEQAEQARAALKSAIRSPGSSTVARSDLETIMRTDPRDTNEYLYRPVAEWMHPGKVYEDRFVDLQLWVDKPGGLAGHTPAEATSQRFDSLDDALTERDEPVVTLVGVPGAGKSTLLRQLEVVAARRFIRGESDVVPVYIEMRHVPQESVASAGDARAWLEEAATAVGISGPGLSELIEQRRLLLLLDGLNELPHSDSGSYREKAFLWRECLHAIADSTRGNRVIATCRTLDYTTPLSSPARLVPRLVIQPLDDRRIQQLLNRYLGEHGETVWSGLAGTALADMLHVPYYLRLLVEQIEPGGRLPTSRAGLFTGFVLSALKRNADMGSALFAPGRLLSVHDYERLQWLAVDSEGLELPEEGCLLPSLGRLAMSLYKGSRGPGAELLALPYPTALDLLGIAEAADVLRAGVALGILDEDRAHNTIEYTHAQMQEYFEGRVLAHSPEPTLAARPWQSRDASPPIEDVLATLHSSEPLPLLAQTGWEEPMLFASEMAPDPAVFVKALAEHNLSLAGRCLAQQSVRSRVSEEVVARIQVQLIDRSRNPDADLRERIVCADTLSALGDFRFSLVDGPLGEFLLPPMVGVAGAAYPMGSDEVLSNGAGEEDASHTPLHVISLRAFEIGQFPVTRMEWQYFMNAGGYTEEAKDWWGEDGGQAWLMGQSSEVGDQINRRYWRARFHADANLLEDQWRRGALEEDAYQNWRDWMTLSDTEFDAVLNSLYPLKRYDAPRLWSDERFNHPLQPVVGISAYEAEAYCNWLSLQTGHTYRLPTEAEWEAAARGREGRDYPWGREPRRLAINSPESHLRRPSPIGIFPDGDTPSGITDLLGNVQEWTASAMGDLESPERFGYPYDQTDGREIGIGDNLYRSIRGGGWGSTLEHLTAWRRFFIHASTRQMAQGMRLVRVVDVDAGGDQSRATRLR